MTYLLDICAISTLRKKSTVEGMKLRNWVASHEDRFFFMSVLTIGELQFGITKLSEKDDKVKNALQSWLLGEVIPSFGNRILPIDQQICSLWGTMSAEAAKKGVILPISDALIAATAIKHDLIVVTQNVKHFKATNARLFDPLA
jgi:predicted nucleic acid-binding protein